MMAKRTTKAAKAKRIARATSQRRETIYIVRATKRSPRHRLFLANGTEIRGVAGFHATFEPGFDFLDVSTLDSVASEPARHVVNELTVRLSYPRIVYSAKRPAKK